MESPICYENKIELEQLSCGHNIFKPEIKHSIGKDER